MPTGTCTQAAMRVTTTLIFLFQASVTGAQTNYNEVLRLSNLFYDAQRTGVLPPDIKARIPWRGDSFLGDGADVNLNLTGGFFDAGDMVKFGFPAASAMTVLGWSVVDFSAGYPQAELVRMRSTLRWYADYIMRCHPSANVFHGQVGDGDEDHSVMCRPEECSPVRPTYTCNATAPCSDLAAETAAALATISMVFSQVDPSYSSQVLATAQSLYTFATTHRGLYHNSITDAATFYRSSGDADEMAWGAAWLFRATQTSSYLTTALSFANGLGAGSEFSWDDKQAGVAILMYQITGQASYVLRLSVGLCESL